MRIGRNPNTNARAGKFTDIVLSSMVHLPSLKIDYHKNRLEIVKLSLTTMRENAGRECSTIVWCDTVCSELLEWIKNEYRPTLLIESMGIGKNTAQNMIAGMLPPETTLNLSDDDMFYYPNWLSPQLQIINKVPETVAVSGYPVRTSFRWGNEETLKRLAPYASLQRGRFIPDEWERDFAVSIGRDPIVHKQTTMNDLDVMAEYKGIKFYATSHHCQMIGRAGDIAGLEYRDEEAMGAQRNFDLELDRIGNRLATVERLTRHMGNYIDDQLRKDISNVVK